MTTTIEQKMIEIKAKAAAQKEQAMLNKLSDPAYQERMIKQAIKDEDFNRLVDMENTFRSIVELNPIARSVDGVNRKWTNRYIYSIGESVRILVNLLTGYRYAAAAHRELMYVEFPISIALASAIVDALGSFSYFNTRLGVVVDGQKSDAVKAAELIELVGTTLGMDIDVSKLTQQAMDKLEAKAMAEATANKEAWEQAVAISAANGNNFVM